MTQHHIWETVSLCLSLLKVNVCIYSKVAFMHNLHGQDAQQQLNEAQ